MFSNIKKIRIVVEPEDQTIKQRLKIEAAKKNTTIKKIIERAINLFLTEAEKKDGQNDD